ncbi:MAG: hypothetical protein JSV27_04880 [Candidatus Bathyarchaeota archaeon]|nr:MAG: hypothetical protein JSV27_04880 [Candidatus Bathyarchaeota archaeon]
MIKIKPLGEVKVTGEALKLISNEKAFARIDAGSFWAPVEDDAEKVGAIIFGEGNYAVDAIVETEEGAVGRSHTGFIDGFKLFLGASRLEEMSRAASDGELQSMGFESSGSFIDAADEAIEEFLGTDAHTDRTHRRREEGVLFWSDRENKRNIIVAGFDSLVFIKGGKVFVLNDDNAVSVQDGNVFLQNSGGGRLVIDKHGIREPEELRDLGPMIADRVKRSLRGFMHSHRYNRRWEDAQN